MSDTPRTDAMRTVIRAQPGAILDDWVPVSFARELERENARLREIRWISVEDKMPANGQFFLAFGPGLGNYIGGPEMDICLWDEQLFNEGGTEFCSVKFTHWMPLPCPPSPPNKPKP